MKYLKTVKHFAYLSTFWIVFLILLAGSNMICEKLRYNWYSKPDVVWNVPEGKPIPDYPTCTKICSAAVNELGGSLPERKPWVYIIFLVGILLDISIHKWRGASWKKDVIVMTSSTVIFIMWLLYCLGKGLSGFL